MCIINTSEMKTFRKENRRVTIYTYLQVNRVYINCSQLLTSLLWNPLHVVLETVSQSKTKKQRLASQFLVIAF